MARSKQTNHEIRQRVARRVRQARLSKGWSQEQLAEALGVSVETVSRYEGGKLALSVEMLDRAAGVCGVTVGALVSEDPVGLDPDEMALLDLWRQLSLDGRKALLAMLRWGCSVQGDSAPR